MGLKLPSETVFYSIRRDTRQRGLLAGQVVNQPERIPYVAPRKLRLIFDDLASIPDQPKSGLFDIVTLAPFLLNLVSRLRVDKAG